jgi:Arc/MetJ-type ribon-helix-helix transcriptional regulator
MNPKRESHRSDRLEKTGYRLPKSLVMRVREAVDAGEAKSQNEFVERALRRELDALRERDLHDEYARAASDPDFMAELTGVDKDWDATTPDGLREDG